MSVLVLQLKQMQQLCLMTSYCRRKMRQRMKVLQAMQAGGWYVPW
jgi:hypothetical protein